MKYSRILKSGRLLNLRAQFPRMGLEGMLVFAPANITYLTEYDSRDSYLLVLPKKAVYITDSRYTAEARRALKDRAEVHQIRKTALGDIVELVNASGMKRVGFEGRYLSYAQHARLKENLRPDIELVPTGNLVEDLRMFKEPKELEAIREAIRITGKALALVEGLLRPGMKEVEVVAEVERFVRYEGARGSSFDMIVASGPNAAYPHHISGERKLQEAEPVKVDMGVDYLGYKSDLTRTFFLGTIKPLVRSVYGIVRDAQERAIRKIKPGVRVCELDRAARGYITKKGYGKFFGHNLGHGVGLEVHELPYLSGTAQTVLKPGMVFTVEPGIYLPGKFGVRIEDMVVVTQSTCEVLSGSINK